MKENSFIRYDNPLFLGLLTVGLFLPAIYLPGLGKLFSLFAAIPIVLATLLFGANRGMTIGLIAFLLLIALSGGNNPSTFLAEVLVLGVVMGETLARKLCYEQVILISAGLAAAALLFILYFVTGIDKVERLVSLEINSGISETIKMYEESGVDAVTIEKFRSIGEPVRAVALMAIPSLFTVSILFSAFISYIGTRVFWVGMRKNEQELFEVRPLWMFTLPEQLVWVFIGSALLLIFSSGEGSGAVLGINGLILTALLYMIQGIAVAQYFFIKHKVHLFLRLLFYLFLAAQPVFALLLTGLGLFETWMGLRKKEEENPADGPDDEPPDEPKNT